MIGAARTLLPALALLVLGAGEPKPSQTVAPPPKPEEPKSIAGAKDLKAERANRLAAYVLRAEIRKRYPGGALPVRIWVARGRWDQVQGILGALGIEYRWLGPAPGGKVEVIDENAPPEEPDRKRAALEPPPAIAPQDAVLVNCGDVLPPAHWQAIAAAVQRGTFLVTSDWTVNRLQRWFPGTIQRKGNMTGRPDAPGRTREFVEVDHALKDHPAAEGVLLPGVPTRWWLEVESFPIFVIDANRVKAILSSEGLKRRYGTDAVAVHFPAGRGHVFHTLSHFFLQYQLEEADVPGREKALDLLKRLALVDGEALKRIEEDAGLKEVPADAFASAYAAQRLLLNVLLLKAKQNEESQKASPTAPSPPPTRR